MEAVQLPKDGFFAHQVMWDGWVDVERPRAHVVGHWNYATATRKNVYVLSSAETVEQFVNGKSLGYGEQSSRFLFTFRNVGWKAGTLRAVGCDSAGKRIAEASKNTAGRPAAVRLTPRTLGHVTLSCPPSVERRLRIELSGAVSNHAAFGNIVEIPGTPDPQSAAGEGGSKSTLSIIEIEIYEPAAGGGSGGTG